MMKEHVLLAALWVFYCFLHSVLASLSVKKWVAQKTGAAFKYYRLLYTLFAFAGLVGIILYWIRIASPLLFTPTTVSIAAGCVLAVVGLVIMIICIKKYFLSLSGLKTLLHESPPGNTLMISGIHRYVRHPLYLGTFMFLWGGFIAQPFLSFFVTNFVVTVYTLIGIELEEKKLQAEFGPDYKHYQRTVPKLIPYLRSKRA